MTQQPQPALDLLEAATSLIRIHDLPYASIRVGPNGDDETVVAIDAGTAIGVHRWAQVLGAHSSDTDRFAQVRSLRLPGLFVYARQYRPALAREGMAS